MNNLLERWICNHGHTTMKQDGGIVIYIECWREWEGRLGAEAHYVETLEEARKALGY